MAGTAWPEDARARRVHQECDDVFCPGINQRFPKREFFKIDPEKIVLAISIGDFKEITPGAAPVDQEEQQALEKAKSRRPKIRLDALGIKVGDILTFSRDESIRKR